MKLLSIKPSDRPTKKYVATFMVNDKPKTVHFGYKGSQTFLDHKDEKKRLAYVARHRVNENFNDPLTAGSLSRYILWNKTTLSASIADFKKRFNL
ncbi:MAG: hypothetical protein EBV05_09410 [Cyanobacteria bacterium WB6_1B_304]|nr:hypothetical protein [Cyanobacteria bacterium WB6_1B_304]